MTQLRDEPEAQALRAKMTQRAEEVADEIKGTCKSLHDVASDEERDNDDFCAKLDELVAECPGCEWWVEADEPCSENYCTDCHKAGDCSELHAEADSDEEDEDDDDEEDEDDEEGY